MKKIIGVGVLAFGLMSCSPGGEVAGGAANFDQSAMPQPGEEILVLNTSFGEMKLRLFPSEAPEHVTNIKELAKSGYYDGLTFHRIIPGFMIQGGDPDGTGTGGHSYKGPGTNVPDERNKEAKHIYGALAMAKTAAPDSAGSQFYIVNKKTGVQQLDGGYTVFGQLFEGEDALDSISAVETYECGPGEFQGCDKPLEDVMIISASIEQY